MFKKSATVVSCSLKEINKWRKYYGVKNCVLEIQFPL